MIYLDYAANTPVDKEVLDYYYDISLKYYGNPNSKHILGREAKRVVDESTKKIAKLLNVREDEIIYTSGSTESNNLALKGVAEKYKEKGKHIIISALEHSSIVASANYLLDQGFDIDILPVKKDGLVDIDELKRLLRDDTILVSVTSVDSEIGLKQPIEEIGKLLKKYPNTYFHTDATGAIGKVDIDFKDVDLVTFTPHKFYGINGMGVLIKKENVDLVPIINGGRSTTIYRSGTPIVPLIAATAKALDIALSKREERFNYVSKLNKKIIDHLKKYDIVHINNTENSIPFTINFSIKGVNSNDFAKKMDEEGVCISTKTSCSLEKAPSRAVYALTKDKNLSKESLRVSLSHLTASKEINEFFKIFDKCLNEVINKNC